MFGASFTDIPAVKQASGKKMPVFPAFSHMAALRELFKQGLDTDRKPRQHRVAGEGLRLVQYD
jgi:hypothetical protein